LHQIGKEGTVKPKKAVSDESLEIIVNSNTLKYGSTWNVISNVDVVLFSIIG
jgi:hypothetical protein